MTANLENFCASTPATKIMPRDESGDFLYPDRPYVELTGRARLIEINSSELVYRHPAVPEIAGVAARAIRYSAETRGEHYDVLRLEPLTDEALVNGRSFNVTPAYITRHDEGITLALAMHAVNEGFSVTSISQERQASHGKYFPSLDTTALNHFTIADTIERERGNQDDKLSYDEFGYSRGGILAYRRARLAHQLGRSAGLVEVLAAVCHHDSSRSRTIKMFASLPFYEAVEVLGQIIDNPQQIKLLADTVGHDLETIIHAYDSAGPLLGARTADVINDLPSHQRGTTSVYGRDPFGHKKAFLGSFANHPNMRTRHIGGLAHLGAMRQSERIAFGERLQQYASTAPSPERPAAA